MPSCHYRTKTETITKWRPSRFAFHILSHFFFQRTFHPGPGVRRTSSVLRTPTLPHTRYVTHPHIHCLSSASKVGHCILCANPRWFPLLTSDSSWRSKELRMVSGFFALVESSDTSRPRSPHVESEARTHRSCQGSNWCPPFLTH